MIYLKFSSMIYPDSRDKFLQALDLSIMTLECVIVNVYDAFAVGRDANPTC